MRSADRRRTAHSALNRPLALLVAATFFMENLDGTIIATAAPAIGADLNVNPVDVNLAMTAYLITIAAGIPISGWLTDRFGGRRVFMTAIAIFTVASLLCALSVSFPMLVGSRVLQGAGGALMVPVGRLVVLRVTAKRDMLDAVAYLTWPALLAPVIAPALGGWIITVASWHWIFLINIPARDRRPCRGDATRAQRRADTGAATGLGGLHSVRGLTGGADLHPRAP